MNTKNVENIINPPEPHYVGDGFRVHNFIPSRANLTMKRMSPFILLDYNSKFYFPPSDKPKGVGVHPHRGFETVTIAYKGRVAHNDSYGNSGVIGEGDVQWMTAASGILHKEFHEKEFSLTGGNFQIVQLWVNLPAKDKMSKPKYQAITNEKINKYIFPNNAGIIEVIAGKYKNIEGTASTFTPINLFNAKIKKGNIANFSFPSHFNTAVLVIEGELIINGIEIIKVNNFALFENFGEDFRVEAKEDSIFLIMSGEPIDEPIASYGPFVMNTQSEILQAFDDFNSGKFGHLDD